MFIDEIDKLARKRETNHRDVNGESVQQGLLKLLEGAEVEVPVGASSKNAMVPMVTVDTTNILFICGGAFPDLDQVIRERLAKKSSMGFNAELKDHYDNEKNIFRYVETEDLRNFGMIPEFLGRLPIVFTLDALDEKMLTRILSEPKNALLKQYRELLAMDEVDLIFEPDALEAIAAKALKKDTGARALRAIIEDFMLAANETVAEDCFWQELPFVYRTHDNPDPDRMRKLAAFINNFGYSIHLKDDEVHPKELQKLLAKLEETPEEDLISRLTLRSMKQVKYTTECTGHFGLAAKYYCHFTSPIRRYPDLQIHRIIKDVLRGRMNGTREEHYRSILPEVARQSSERERKADEAERETIKLKKVEYMSHHLWEEFDGVISGVTAWGIYVELPNTVEGLVRTASLQGDYFEYNESACAMVGVHTGKSYAIGQKVKVQVTGADKMTRTIDFELAEDEEE